MYIFLIVFQVIISLLLITIILMQSGRGGGLVESLSGVESIFGAKTNVFLVRTTAIISSLFLLNCLALAYISTQRSKSLMEKTVISQEEKKTDQTTKQVATQETKQTTEEVEKENVQNVQEEVTPSAILESESKSEPKEEIDKTKSQQE